MLLNWLSANRPSNFWDLDQKLTPKKSHAEFLSLKNLQRGKLRDVLVHLARN